MPVFESTRNWMTMIVVTSKASAPPITCSRLRWRMKAARSRSASRGPTGRGKKDMGLNVSAWAAARQPRLAFRRRLEPRNDALLADPLDETGHFRSAVAPGDRQAERMEQGAALGAGRFLHCGGERLPGLSRPVETGGDDHRLTNNGALLMIEVGRVDVTMKDGFPKRIVGNAGEIRADQFPVLGRRSIGKAVSDDLEWKRMDQPCIEELDVMKIEMGRRPPEMREVEAGGELLKRWHGFDRLRCADPGENRQQGHRLE